MKPLIMTKLFHSDYHEDDDDNDYDDDYHFDSDNHYDEVKNYGCDTNDHDNHLKSNYV